MNNVKPLPQSTEEILAWLEEAKQIVHSWHVDLEQLHRIYKTTPSADIDKVTTAAYHLLQYMQVLSIAALMGTTFSTLREVMHGLDPQFLMGLQPKEEKKHATKKT